jgi:hypothetical protein
MTVSCDKFVCIKRPLLKLLCKIMPNKKRISFLALLEDYIWHLKKVVVNRKITSQEYCKTRGLYAISK